MASVVKNLVEKPNLLLRKRHEDIIPSSNKNDNPSSAQSKLKIFAKKAFKTYNIETVKQEQPKDIKKRKIPVKCKQKPGKLGPENDGLKVKSDSRAPKEIHSGIKKTYSNSGYKLKRGMPNSRKFTAKRINVVTQSRHEKISTVMHPIKTKNAGVNKENIDSKSFHLSKKIWQLLNLDILPNLDNNKNADKLIRATDSKVKNNIENVLKKNNKKELKHKNPPDVTDQTCEDSELSSKRYRSQLKKALKCRVKRQLWYWAKIAIKNNEHWSKLFEDNSINIDKVNIDQIDLSIIDVDALGIENKFLKRSVTWLLK